MIVELVTIAVPIQIVVTCPAISMQQALWMNMPVKKALQAILLPIGNDRQPYLPVTALYGSDDYLLIAVSLPAEESLVNLNNAI